MNGSMGREMQRSDIPQKPQIKNTQRHIVQEANILESTLEMKVYAGCIYQLLIGSQVKLTSFLNTLQRGVNMFFKHCFLNCNVMNPFKRKFQLN